VRPRFLLALVLVLVAVLLVRAEVAAPTRIAGDSMSPTLERGDVALVRKVGVTPHRGDLLVFTSPDEGLDTIKRVVGVPGDEVAIRDAVLYVNDELVDEPFVDHEAIDGLYYGPVTVPAGRLILLGDNRANSIDSRSYGPVAVDAVSGRVQVTLWPPGDPD
jgi:signal peptidase I